MFNKIDPELPSSRPGGDSGHEPPIDGQLPHDPEAEDAPLTVRTGRNPANLGDEVPEMGDLMYPTLDPQPAEI